MNRNNDIYEPGTVNIVENWKIKLWHLISKRFMNINIVLDYIEGWSDKYAFENIRINLYGKNPNMYICLKITYFLDNMVIVQNVIWAFSIN